MVRWVYVIFLGLISLMVFYDYYKAVKNRNKSDDPSHTGATGGVNWAPTLHKIKIPPMMHFRVANIHCSIWLPISISFITGMLAGFLGVGGGVLRMPALIYFIGAPTHVAVGTDLFEVMISGLYGAFTYSLKGRIELVAVFVMLCGAAIGAQIGTVATKYAQGYGIRLMFGCAVLACMVSIICKQYGINVAATVIILGAISVICIYIMTIMFRGAANELREKKAPRPGPRFRVRRCVMKKIVLLSILLLALALTAGCLDKADESEVYQGACLAIQDGGKTLVLANSQPKLNPLKGDKALFDISKAKVGSGSGGGQHHPGVLLP